MNWTIEQAYSVWTIINHVELLVIMINYYYQPSQYYVDTKQ